MSGPGYYDDQQRGRQHGYDDRQGYAPDHHRQQHRDHRDHHQAAASGPACGRCAGTGMFEGTTCPVCQGSRVDPSGATRSYAAEGEAAPGQDGERGFGKTALGAMAGGIAGHKFGGHGVLGALGGALAGHVVGDAIDKRRSRSRSDRRHDDGLAYGDDHSGRHSHHDGRSEHHHSHHHSRPSSSHSHHSHHSHHSSQHHSSHHGDGGSTVAASGYGESLRPDDGHHHHHHRHGSRSRSRGREGDDGYRY